ncbi:MULTISPECIES: hypothetical protein [Phytobacter]|uniref:Uncharacterized protein n=1 Tax=Phytobacter diazotrophicus TaxID=395631 RepID=A0ABM7VWI1_9ENTR|nr:MULTISPECIES: hypothetical protein [Phytobacter]MDU4150002.1 hypothetical protein [Enterobacteriaceae bacterium]MDU7380777.1 hypothetical protein [Enterobacteriaceae bacterium]BBE78089.1 hypothetical protein MRY16398_31450 [Phytobacter sp. MRY16-398]BDD51463.1 hypothetical protein PDTA9734_29500 [Phytobacter diazotrophicus]BEG82492.1 hypothetical protein PDTA9730_29480 [Phytobacter diazotrophicus]
MMKKHRLHIFENQTEIGFMEVSDAKGEALLEQVQISLSSGTGLSFTRTVSAGERRILESSPQGIKLLSSETLFSNR